MIDDVIVRQTLNPAAPFFFPKNHSLHRYYFSPPPFYLFADTSLPPPPSIFVYYPLRHINLNPNRFVFMQEVPPLHSQNPSQELTPSPTIRKRGFGRKGYYGHRKKMTWRREIHHQVESNDDHVTTVMVRNIPNRYTRAMMMEFLDEHCAEENSKEKDEENPISAYDFLYLPMDFNMWNNEMMLEILEMVSFCLTEMNKGYAFVNFTNVEAVSKFKAACNDKPWSNFRSRKVLEVAYARIQASSLLLPLLGKYELTKNFQKMKYPVEEYSAVCFCPARSGLKNAVQTIMVGKCTEPVVSD
ncbi:unnamed protein product [Thlaspi arvense]|uniref:Mei2-like C-terminal RNA recognition motif domain-containing protein n=1 Tax=Thlaspi arvense TaxID=13288 RepID=A0AAU9SZX2_THLAR|nr:unnamed protein product [Thlaspi arvense]